MAVRRRLVGPDGLEATTATPSSSSCRRWLDMPQDVCVLVCQYLGPSDLVLFLPASRRSRDLGLLEAVWRFFCLAKWGPAANLGIYSRAKDLCIDGNGWFPPSRCSRPFFEVNKIQFHNLPCLTMDLRVTEEEIFAVSERPSKCGKAGVHVIDPVTGNLLDHFQVSAATINCCDVGRGLVCLGSEDGKVRIYSRSGDYGGERTYRQSVQFGLMNEVNDLRLTVQDSVVAVRTHANRHPAGLDILSLDRPDAKTSLEAGSEMTRGKYVHAVDGFEGCCSLHALAASGEHPLTSAFSAMLFDFRRPSPCVADLPVTSLKQGHPVGTMLWPLRAGQSPVVYANLMDEGRRGCGRIAMVDFRYPAAGVVTNFELPGHVDDFRCFGGHIYAACTELGPTQQLSVYRCSHSEPQAQHLCTVVEAYKPVDVAQEDLKVLSVCQRGFAVSFGEGQLVTANIMDPRGREEAPPQTPLRRSSQEPVRPAQLRQRQQLPRYRSGPVPSQASH